MNLLILGANGQLARHTLPFLLQHENINITLYLRRSSQLKNLDPQQVKTVEGDVLDERTLTASMQGQDLVYANLSGNIADQSHVIINSMHAAEINRFIFISSMGIYGEVPGERYRPILDPYCDSAHLIESSVLDYTILRRGWFHQRVHLDIS